ETSEMAREDSGAADPEAEPAVGGNVRPAVHHAEQIEQAIAVVPGVIRGGEVDRRRRKYAHAVELSAVQPHLIEAREIEDGRARPASRDRRRVQSGLIE